MKNEEEEGPLKDKDGNLIIKLTKLYIVIVLLVYAQPSSILIT